MPETFLDLWLDIHGIHCCVRPNYNLCISQNSVATVLMWDEQNCI